MFLTAILIIASVICVSAQSSAKVFRGYINGIQIQVSLVRDGDKLSGSYFYTRVGKELKLSGTIDAEGNFKLTEKDATGKTTGEFSGTWKDEKNSNGAYLEGEWHKPNSQETLGFSVSEQVIESATAKFTTKNFNEKNKIKRFDINIEYPELSGVNPAIAAKFNLLAKNQAMSGVAEFRKAMMSQTKEDLKYLPAEMNNYMEVSYSIEWATNDIISIEFTNSEFTGGAHPNYALSSLNFDMKTGAEIKLANLFEPKTNYLKTISDFSIAELKSQMGEMTDEEWISNGAGAKAENYTTWNLTRKGLMITFDPYQVAAYAAGSQTVIIPYEKLNGLKPNFMPQNK